MIGALLSLIGILIGGSVAWAAADGQEDVCNSSAVLFCDNFEARALGNLDLRRSTFKNPGWAMGYTVGPGNVAAGEGVNGSKGFRFDYPAHGPGIASNSGDPANGGGGYMAMTYAYVRTVWFRWYTRWSSNWVRSQIGEKQFIVQYGNGPTNTSTFVGHVQWASAPLLQYVHDPSKYYYPTAPVPALNYSQWNCFEARVTLNSSATVSDGALEFYVNGTLITNAPNIRLASFSNAVQFQTLLSAYYNCTTTNCQGTADAHPAMQRWHDNFVVATQRVGCLGAVAPAPTSPTPQPPAAPSNLTLR